MYDHLIKAFTLDNWPLLLVSAWTFLLGYLEYIYSFWLMRREKKAPYPIWMHTFYFAHDSSWAVILFGAASRHDWNWFLLSCAIALAVWNCFEAYNIYKALTVERQEIWGEVYRGEVSFQQAALTVLLQLAAFYCLVNVLIGFMGEGSVMQWFLFTNMLIAAAPGVLWMKRGVHNGTREGASMGLAVVILVATVNTFHPYSMWVLAMPEVFSTPWYYISGVVFSGIAAFNLYNLARLPPKKQLPGQESPIW